MNVLSFSDKFKRARYYGNVANKSLYSASRLMKLRSSVVCIGLSALRWAVHEHVHCILELFLLYRIYGYTVSIVEYI